MKERYSENKGYPSHEIIDTEALSNHVKEKMENSVGNHTKHLHVFSTERHIIFTGLWTEISVHSPVKKSSDLFFCLCLVMQEKQYRENNINIEKEYHYQSDF